MRNRFFGSLQLLLDLALVAGSYYLVYVARGALGFPYEAHSLVTLGRVLPWLLLTFVILYFVYNLGAESPGGYYESFLGLVLTVVLLMVISYALSFAIRQFGCPGLWWAWRVWCRSLASVSSTACCSVSS